LGATLRLEESEEFKSLAESTNAKLKSLQTDLKTSILGAARLENELFLKDITQTYCEAVNKLGTISLLAKTNQNSVSDDTIHQFVLYSIAKDKRSLQYTFNGSFDAFAIAYNAKYPNNFQVVFESNAAPPPTTATAANTNRGTTTTGTVALNRFAAFRSASAVNDDSDDDNEIMAGDTDETANITASTTTTKILVRDTPNYINTFSHSTVTSFGNLAYQIFAASWASYINEHNNKMLNAKLLKFATMTMESKATDNAARILNSEPTVDPQTLQDLIRQNVEKETSNLRTTIAKLQQNAKRSVKNVKRGDKVKSRASVSKKQTIPTTPTKTGSKRQKTPKKGSPKKGATSQQKLPATKTSSKLNNNRRKRDSADAPVHDTPSGKKSKQRKNSARKTPGTKHGNRTRST
jgi:hypothetical protein